MTKTAQGGPALNHEFKLLRGGLRLSDISENPNNDRIDGYCHSKCALFFFFLPV